MSLIDILRRWPSHPSEISRTMNLAVRTNPRIRYIFRSLQKDLTCSEANYVWETL